MPPGMGGLECHHIRHRELSQPTPQTAILPVEGVSHHRAERPAFLERLLDELQGDCELGAKVRIVLAFSKVALRSVRLDLQWVIHPLIGPQAGDGNHPVVDLAQIPQILTRHMSRLVTILAISRLINHQDSLSCGSRRGVLAQQFEPLRLDLALIPIRLREKPLQRLGSRHLCSYHRLGVDQSGERLVSFAWQKETLHIASKSFTLITLAKQGIKLSHILFQWCWGSCYFDAFCHLLLCLLCPHATTFSPGQQTTASICQAGTKDKACEDRE